MTNTRKRDPIPERFDSVGAAAEFWDTHDTTDYEDLMHDVEMSAESTNACRCGCGEPTSGGEYRPGHDQKHRASLERQAGGLPGLIILVEAARDYADGRISLEHLGNRVQQVFLTERKDV
jgi:hypothetical protein